MRKKKVANNTRAIKPGKTLPRHYRREHAAPYHWHERERQMMPLAAPIDIAPEGAATVAMLERETRFELATLTLARKSRHCAPASSLVTCGY